MSVVERAVTYFVDKKYNCCQAVVCAYCDEYDVDDKEVFKLAEGFGGGMGGMQSTCGAVTGMFMAIGLHNSAGDKSKPTKTKQDTYQAVKDMAKIFEELNGSLDCRDLKKIIDGTQIVSCQRCVEVGAKLVEKYIKEY